MESKMLGAAAALHTIVLGHSLRTPPHGVNADLHGNASCDADLTVDAGQMNFEVSSESIDSITKMAAPLPYCPIFIQDMPAQSR